MKLYSETVLISKYAIGIILSASLYFLSLLSWVFYPSSAFQPSYRSLWSGVVGLHSPLEVGMTSIRDANNRVHLASDTAWTSGGWGQGKWWCCSNLKDVRPSFGSSMKMLKLSTSCEPKQITNLDWKRVSGLRSCYCPLSITVFDKKVITQSHAWLKP